MAHRRQDFGLGQAHDDRPVGEIGSTVSKERRNAFLRHSLADARPGQQNGGSAMFPIVVSGSRLRAMMRPLPSTMPIDTFAPNP